MLFVMNIIAILYMILLFKKKYSISLSIYWMIIFYAIYIFVPTFRDQISFLNNIEKQLVEKIAIYSLIGLLSFISTNCIFLLKWRRLGLVDIGSQFEISFIVVKRLILFLVIVSISLLLLTVGTNGITKIFSTGSRGLWFNQQNKNIFYTFAELSLFYVTITGSLLVLSAKTNQQKCQSLKIFAIIIIVISILVFARRHVIYPIFAVIFYWLSRQKNRVKILIIAAIFMPLFFIAMFLMGYFRTFGIANFTLTSMIDYFKYGNFMDIFISNTDFAASYFFLSKQIDYGSIFVGPLGYFKLFFTLIPRSIWISKPDYTSIEILSIIEPIKVREGFSAGTGYIGEALATLGTAGIILVSAAWGIFCGYMDKKYHYILDKKRKKTDNKIKDIGFTLFEYFYLYSGSLLITESHRGDFGAASIHFVLEILLLGIIVKVFSKKYKRKLSPKINLRKREKR